MANMQTNGRRLTLVRHAEAGLAPAGASDHQRPLTANGRRWAHTLGATLAQLNLFPDCLISSDALRAAQTARDLVADAGRELEPTLLADLYHGGPDEIPTIIEENADPSARHTLVVGHNPAIAAAAEYFAAQSDRVGLVFEEFAPGTAATFTLLGEGWRRLGPDTVRLEHVHRPAM